MAQTQSTDIANAIGQDYPEVYSTVYRTFLLAQIIPVRPGHGKNDSFDVRFRGTQGARNMTEGQEVTEYVSDTFVPATGVWAEYDAAIKVTGLALAIAHSTGASTPSEIRELRREALVAAYEELAVKLRTDAYTGASTNPQSLYGLLTGATTGALGSTGTYYNINRGGAAPLQNWAGNVLRNGGVNRPITSELLDSALTAVFDARGTRPDVLITSSAICDALAATFNRSYTQDIGAPAGRKIILQGGYTAIYHSGIPLIRDPGCPANTIIGLDLSAISFRQLAQDTDAFVRATTTVLQASGNVDFPSGTVPLTVMVKPLSIGGDYIRSQVTWKGQLRVHDPARHFVLEDVSA